MSAREAPLRAIVRTYTEPTDGGRYQLLDCGHSLREDSAGGARKRRCGRCREAVRWAERNLARAGQ